MEPLKQENFLVYNVKLDLNNYPFHSNWCVNLANALHETAVCCHALKPS